MQGRETVVFDSVPALFVKRQDDIFSLVIGLLLSYVMAWAQKLRFLASLDRKLPRFRSCVDFYWAAQAVCCRMLEMPRALIRRRLQLLCRVAMRNRSNLCFPTFHLLGACAVPPDLMAMSALAVSGLGMCKDKGWAGEE